MAYIVKKEKTVEGTAFSIENVVSLKSLELYGNTYQQTYTGKNLLKTKYPYHSISNGVTISVSEDFTITLQGTATAEQDFNIIQFLKPLIANKQYSLNLIYVSGSFNGQLGIFNEDGNHSWQGWDLVIQSSQGMHNYNMVHTFNYAWNSSISIVRAYKDTVYNNFKFKLQFVADVNYDYDYEPYVGGVASPNPEYPQEVQTVTGRQVLNVVGKNLFIPTLTNNGVDISQVYCTATLNGDEYSLTATGADMRIGTVRNADLPYEDILGTLYPVNNAERIYLYLTNEIFNKNFINWYDENKVSLGYTPISSPNSSAGVPSNAKYFSIRFGYGNAVSGTTYSTKVMVSYTPITEYEPYIGKQYEINLGKNLCNGVNQLVYLNNATTQCGVASGDTGLYIKTNGGNYTISTKITQTRYRVACINNIPSSTTQTAYNGVNKDGTSDSITIDTTGYNYLIVNATDLSAIQIEKGSQATSYSAYKTPIELCKIGDYLDSIKKSTGKNLFDKSNANVLNAYIGTNTIITYEINNKTIYIPCKPNTTYTISKMIAQPQTTNRFRIGTTNTIPQINDSVSNFYNVGGDGSDATEYTYTTNSTARYLLITVMYSEGSTTLLEEMLATLQIEENSQKTYYEPYGKVWYIHKEIGKVVLDGSENWSLVNGVLQSVDVFPNNIRDIGATLNAYSNNFTYKYYASSITTQIQNGEFGWNSGKKLTINNANLTTKQEYVDWLSTHNTDVYYPLANPETSEITNIELINQLNSIELLEGLNNVTISSDDLVANMSMNYYERINEYYNTIYSGDARHKIKIWFNDVELEDADRYCEKLTRQARILSNDGSKRFTIDNFMAQELELVLHRINPSIIQDQVKIELGTLIDEENDTYAYVPLGIFNIQDNPKTDKDKITIKLRDNRVKFDFSYNAQPLIEENSGTATKLQILNDICTQAGVVNTVTGFTGQNDEIGIYDSTITATMYIAYIASQAGAIAIINRYGELEFIYLNELKKVKVPLYLVEKYELGTQYSIERVVYEDGIRKFQTSDDENLSTLYIGSDNPYISSQEQIDTISSKLIGFNIDSCTTGKIMGDPSIDAYDILEIYGYYNTLPNGNKEFVDDEDTVVVRTLANHTMTYTGKIISVYDTQIGKEARTENVSLNGEARFQRYAKTSIDNINNNINLIVGEQTEQSERISNLQIDINSIQNLFQITGGTNLIKNSQFLLRDDVWTRTIESDGYCTELGEGYNSNLIGQTTAIANIVMKNATITSKNNNIVGLKVGQQYVLNYYYTLDASTTATITLTGTNSGNVVFTKTYNTTQATLKREIISFNATETDYILSITTNTTLNGYFTIYDLMLNSGDVKNWEPSTSEIYSTVLKMSQLGLQVYASGSNTITLLTSQGFTIYTSSNGEIGQVVTEFTDTGIETIDIIASGMIKNGIYVEKDLTINSYIHHIEYMESD